MKTKLTLLFAIISIIITKVVSAKVPTHLQYYTLKHKAEMELVNGHFLKSLKSYKKLFKIGGNLSFGNDILNALVVAKKINKLHYFGNEIKLLTRRGVTISNFKDILTLDSSTVSLIEKYTDHATLGSSINNELLQEIAALVANDQATSQYSANNFDNNNQRRKDSVYNTSCLIGENLKEVFAKYSVNENTLGYFNRFKYHVILIHNYQAEGCSLNFDKEISTKIKNLEYPLSNFLMHKMIHFNNKKVKKFDYFDTEVSTANLSFYISYGIGDSLFYSDVKRVEVENQISEVNKKIATIGTLDEIIKKASFQTVNKEFHFFPTNIFRLDRNDIYDSQSIPFMNLRFLGVKH
jgi:hypothetical protein